MRINHPETLTELARCHERYEKALAENDVATLDGLYWSAPHALQYGVTENLYGGEEIRASRQDRPDLDRARTVTRLEIVTFGEDFGIVNLEFTGVMKGVARQGRQTQLWHRFVEGWKIVSAHVSLLPAPSSYVAAAAAQIGLPIADEYLAAVEEDLARAAALAQFMMEFPLPQIQEAAPVFQP